MFNNTISITQEKSLCNSGEVEKGGKWYRKKAASVEIGKELINAGLVERGARMATCGNEIIYTHCPECGTYHVVGASLCKDRLCPVCAWRLSLKRYAEMCRVMDALYPAMIDNGYTVGMITLTVKNCELAELRTTLTDMAKALKRLMLRKSWKNTVVGYARSIEITHNWIDNTFHPHYHILVILKSSTTMAAATHDIAEDWGASLRVSYIPIVHGQNAYKTKRAREMSAVLLKAMDAQKNTHTELGDGGVKLETIQVTQEEISGAIMECVKYIGKGDAAIDLKGSKLVEYAFAVSGCRMMSYGGLIKQQRAILGLTDSNDELTSEDLNIDVLIKCKCGTEIQAKIADWSIDGWRDRLSNKAVKSL